MANRPVFVSIANVPYFRTYQAEFKWNNGQTDIQQQKNIQAIHAAFLRDEPLKKVLEISSKSEQPGGDKLSAFEMKKKVPSLGKSVPVECVYQAGKMFENVGPFKDLLESEPLKAKRDARLGSSGKLTGFAFEGKSYPIVPEYAFYNFIYILALIENPELAKIVREYDAFTDIAFNPQKGRNCQARAAAVYASLCRYGRIDPENPPDPGSLFALLSQDSAAADQLGLKKPVEKKTPLVKPGCTIVHTPLGEGTVLEVTGAIIKVSFPSVGEKTLGLDWCRKNCTFSDTQIASGDTEQVDQPAQCPEGNDTKAKHGEALSNTMNTTTKNDQRIPAKIKVGGNVVFGQYVQDAQAGKENPVAVPKSIVWQVLDVKDDKALLLSRDGLDARPYNTEWANVTWEHCTLRSWLNSEFLKAAFTDEEKNAILSTYVCCSREHGKWVTNGGSDTQDKVFLLSYAEANLYLDVTTEENDATRVFPTGYTKAQGAETSDDDQAAGWWWLRSPGLKQDRAAFVGYNGSLGSHYVSDASGCVRPALWVDLEMVSR